MRPDDTCPDGAVRIPLRARDGSVRAYVIVDAVDANWVNQWRWCLAEGYASRGAKIGGRWTTVYLHRALLGLTPGDGMEGDHENRDRLNCRRSNLRALPWQGRPNQQNKAGSCRGTSRHRGVYWDPVTSKWRAEVAFQGRRYKLGRFLNEEEAAEAARRKRLSLMPYAVD